MMLLVFMKIKKGIFGSAPEAEQAAMMGNPFEILQRKKDCPMMMLIQSLKTKQENSGLAQGAMPASMTEKHLPF